DPIGIEWRQLPDDVFFDIDGEARMILLNKRFRSAMLGGRNGSLNDAPMLKALMFFLLHDVFGKERNGSRIKDNLALWQSVLISAARVERDQAGL
ncbi:ATP-binding protein, partial [Nocardia sp. NPDC060220]